MIPLRYQLAIVALVVGMALLCASPCAAQSPDDATFLHDEAGIAAYTKVLPTINLSNVAYWLDSPRFGTDYVVGKFSDRYYGSQIFSPHDVYVYANADGWMITYFTREVMTSEIFLVNDGYDFDGYSVLHFVLSVVGGTNGVLVKGVDYFDFRYPNAEWMLCLGTHLNREFQIRFFDSHTVYEQSWVLMHKGDDDEVVTFLWDTKPLSTCYGPGWNHGVLSAPGVQDHLTHTVSIAEYTEQAYGVVAITYEQLDGPIFLLQGTSNFTQIPMRYPRELIRDRTPPAITSAITKVVTSTHGTFYSVDFEFSELVQYAVSIFKYYSADTYEYTKISNPDYTTHGNSIANCPTCIRVEFFVEAYDMSWYMTWNRYSIEHALHLNHHAYLPTLKRNQEATP